MVLPLVEKCRFSLFSEGGGVDGADVKMLRQRPERRSESDVLGVWNACGEDSCKGSKEPYAGRCWRSQREGLLADSGAVTV